MPDDDGSDREPIPAIELAAHNQLPDLYLAVLAWMANEFDTQLTITVSAGGLIYSGTLVSQQRWLGELASIIDAQGQGGGAASMSTLFREQALEADANSGLGEAAAAEVRYLHLLGVDVWPLPVGFPDGDPWRLRLSSIDAWRLGATAAFEGRSGSPPAGKSPV